MKLDRSLIIYPGKTVTAEDGFIIAQNCNFYLEDLMYFRLLKPDDLYTHVLEIDPKDPSKKFFWEKSLAERLLKQAIKSLKLVKQMAEAGVRIPEMYKGIFGGEMVPEEREMLLNEEDYKHLMAYSALLTKCGQL
ncbi:hypothetical protein VNI00_017859 [Paramarasmius palmivorus]|uniref:Uncharacterized protein n=1 Tax=Paramarasmius palmivorus TaxID=297713 RepID=A0AAW0B4E5_9AGAR